MALNIKNREVEELAAELARLSGQSKTEVVRRALAAQREALAHQVVTQSRSASFLRFLEEEVWPSLPAHELGRRMSREEREAILGYGADGV